MLLNFELSTLPKDKELALNCFKLVDILQNNTFTITVSWKLPQIIVIAWHHHTVKIKFLVLRKDKTVYNSTEQKAIAANDFYEQLCYAYPQY